MHDWKRQANSRTQTALGNRRRADDERHIITPIKQESRSTPQPTNQPTIVCLPTSPTIYIYMQQQQRRQRRRRRRPNTAAAGRSSPAHQSVRQAAFNRQPIKCALPAHDQPTFLPSSSHHFLHRPFIGTGLLLLRLLHTTTTTHNNQVQSAHRIRCAFLVPPPNRRTNTHSSRIIVISNSISSNHHITNPSHLHSRQLHPFVHPCVCASVWPRCGILLTHLLYTSENSQKGKTRSVSCLPPSPSI